MTDEVVMPPQIKTSEHSSWKWCSSICINLIHVICFAVKLCMSTKRNTSTVCWDSDGLCHSRLCQFLNLSTHLSCSLYTKEEWLDLSVMFVLRRLFLARNWHFLFCRSCSGVAFHRWQHVVLALVVRCKFSSLINTSEWLILPHI